MGLEGQEALVGLERQQHDALGVGEEDGPGLSQAEASLVSGEESGAVVALQGVDLHRDRGLRDEKVLRGLGEAQVLGHVVEDLELLQVQVETHALIVGHADRPEKGRSAPSAQLPEPTERNLWCDKYC